MAVILAVCLALAALWSIASARYTTHGPDFQPDHILRVSERVFPVACVTRPSTLVNGTSPGPTLYLKEGQPTWVRVYNDLETKNTTMHWHGLSQSTAPFSDGSPQASQWPIKPGEYFDYEIRPNVGEAGTHFYHTHVGFQAVSATGPLIVLEKDGKSPPYTYDEERILFISEHYNKTDDMIETELLRPFDVVRWTGDPTTILMNGNSFPGMTANDTDTPEPWVMPDPSLMESCGPDVIHVEPDKTYRMRSIGGPALNLVTMGIEDHDELSVMAADAKYTKLAQTDRIQIASGQRFDFLLHTKSEDELRRLGKNVFWIQMESRYRPMNVSSYALLSYNVTSSDLAFNQTTDLSRPEEKPLTLPNKVYDWLEYVLEPLEPNGFPTADKVNRTVVLTSLQLFRKEGVYAAVSNHTWTETNQHRGATPYWKQEHQPGTPYLIDIYKRGDDAIPDLETTVQEHDGWDPDLNVYVARVGEVIDIIMINQPNGLDIGFDLHPWHIHGGHIYDLGSGPGTYNATENEERLKGYNPVIRDTTMLYKYTPWQYVGEGKNMTDQGWRAWRLHVQDPGVWMVHCHTLQHMIMGMQTVWIMGNASEIRGAGTPDGLEGYLTYGGDAYGNASHDPFVQHHFEDETQQVLQFQ
ncbi:L-ascorbate oxidase [Aspergillus filifer]